MSARISRRDFLKVNGVFLMASGLGLEGGAAADASEAQTVYYLWRPEDLLRARIKLIGCHRTGNGLLVSSSDSPPGPLIELELGPQHLAEDASIPETDPMEGSREFVGAVSLKKHLATRLAGPSRLVFALDLPKKGIKFSISQLLKQMRTLSDSDLADRSRIEYPYRVVFCPKGAAAFHHFGALRPRLRDNNTNWYELWHTALDLRIPSEILPFTPPVINLSSSGENPMNSAAELLQPAVSAEKDPRGLLELVQLRKPGQGDSPLADPTPEQGEGKEAARSTSIFAPEINDFDLLWSQLKGVPPNGNLRAKQLILTCLGACANVEYRASIHGDNTLLVWNQRSNLGRDNFIRVVTTGRLLPYQHFVAFVRIWERQLARTYRGTTPPTLAELEKLPTGAVLLRRQFIVILDPIAKLPVNDRTQDPQLDRLARQQLFSEIRIKNDRTPDLFGDPGMNGNLKVFWPTPRSQGRNALDGGQPFVFDCSGTPRDSDPEEFRIPMLFASDLAAGAKEYDKAVGAWRTASFKNGKVPMVSPTGSPFDAKAIAPDGDTVFSALAVSKQPILSLFNVHFAAQAEAIKASANAIDKQNRFAASFETVFSGNPLSISGWTNRLRRDLGNRVLLCDDAALIKILTSLAADTALPPHLRSALTLLKANAQLARTQSELWTREFSDWMEQRMKVAMIAQDQQVIDKCKALLGIFDLTGVNSLITEAKKLVTGGQAVIQSLRERINSVMAEKGNPKKFIQELDDFRKLLPDTVVPLPLSETIERHRENLSKVGKQWQTGAKEIAGQLAASTDDLLAAACSTENAGRVYAGLLKKELIGAQKSLGENLLPVNPDLLVQDIEYRLGDIERSALNLLPSQLHLPHVAQITVEVPSIKRVSPNGARCVIQPFQDYINHGFAQIKDVAQEKIPGVANGLYAQVIKGATPIGKELKAGVIRPVMEMAGLSRELGSINADLKSAENALKALSNTRPPKINIGDWLPDIKLLGSLDLSKLLPALADFQHLPQMVTKEYPDKIETSWEWNSPLDEKDLGLVKFTPNPGAAFKLKTAFEAELPRPGHEHVAKPVISTNGSITEPFTVTLAECIAIRVAKLDFSSGSELPTRVSTKGVEVEFLGPLAFVKSLQEKLAQLLGGDGPRIEITSQHIGVGVSLPVIPISFGAFSLSNIKLVTSLKVPLGEGKMRYRFAFCERSSPFILSISGFAGGGFLALEIDSDGNKMIEGALEFGGAVEVNFTVAQGRAQIMGGLYFRASREAALAMGYLRVSGVLKIIGYIDVCVDVLLGLVYQRANEGPAYFAGRAEVRISFKMGFFSTTVSFEIEKKFAGSSQSNSSTQKQTGLRPRTEGVLVASADRTQSFALAAAALSPATGLNKHDMGDAEPGPSHLILSKMDLSAFRTARRRWHRFSRAFAE